MPYKIENIPANAGEKYNFLRFKTRLVRFVTPKYLGGKWVYNAEADSFLVSLRGARLGEPEAFGLFYNKHYYSVQAIKSLVKNDTDITWTICKIESVTDETETNVNSEVANAVCEALKVFGSFYSTDGLEIVTVKNNVKI